MGGNPDRKFRFEDYKDRWSKREEGKYKTTKQGLEDLKKLHPFGSDLIPLIVTLTKAGARCWRSTTHNNAKRNDPYVACKYIKGFIFKDIWIVHMEFDVKVSDVDTISEQSAEISLTSKNNREMKVLSYDFRWGAAVDLP